MRASPVAGLTTALVVLGAANDAGAQGMADKAIRDETVSVRKDDPLMEAAKQRGRATLPQFLALSRAPKPSMTNFTVKVGIGPRESLEYIWVRPFEKRGQRYSGQLRNDAQTVAKLKYGDTITFDDTDIVDWYYLDDGKMKGNFSACALLQRRPKQEVETFKKQYGLDCEPLRTDR